MALCGGGDAGADGGGVGGGGGDGVGGLFWGGDGLDAGSDGGGARLGAVPVVFWGGRGWGRGGCAGGAGRLLYGGDVGVGGGVGCWREGWFRGGLRPAAAAGAGAGGETLPRVAGRWLAFGLGRSGRVVAALAVRSCGSGWWSW